jgi:hypothetical protein
MGRGLCGPFGLWSKFFPVYRGIQRALRARQPDARGTGRSLAKVALAPPTMQAVYDSWTGPGLGIQLKLVVVVLDFVV